jgi:hypothetical protein
MTRDPRTAERRKMMKKSILVFCLGVLVAGAASAELDTLWIRTYGGPGNDGFRSAIPTADGGALAVGYTHSMGPADVNVFAVRTDADGDTLWARAYGGAGMDYGYGVCEAHGGGYIITGYTTSFGAGAEDVYLIKIDSDGDTVWTRTYGGSEPDEGLSVCATSDGQYAVSGRTDSYGSGYCDLYLLKVDGAGDTAWTRVYGDSLYDWGQSVCETGDGNIGICGSKWGDSDNMDIYVLKVTPSGSLVWDDTYGDTGSINPDWGNWVIARSDTEMVVATFRAIEGRDPLDAGFLRVRLDGASLGYRRYISSYYQRCNSICMTPEDGFMLCGYDKEPTYQTNDLLLIKRVPGSGWVWEQTFGGAGSDWGNSIVHLGGGYYLVSGQTGSTPAGDYDAWLLMLKEPEAGVPAGSRKAELPHLAVPGPNPVSASTTVRFDLPEAMGVQVAVYDVSGRMVALLARGHLEAGAHASMWDGNNLEGRPVSPGVYLVTLSAGEYTATRKAVVLK